MRSAIYREMQVLWENPESVWFTLTCWIKSSWAWYWTAQFWAVGLQLWGLGRLLRTYSPKYAVVVSCVLTDCNQLFAFPFRFYIMPHWRVKFLKSRRQCVISQRRMRLGGKSKGLQRPRRERRGPSNICHQREENWQRRKIVTQLLKKKRLIIFE
jgi:hypothetical protein